MERKTNFFKLNFFFVLLFIFSLSYVFFDIYFLRPKNTVHNLFFNCRISFPNFYEFCLEKAQNINRRKIFFFNKNIYTFSFADKVYMYALAMYAGKEISTYSITYDFKEGKVWRVYGNGSVLAGDAKHSFDVKKALTVFHTMFPIDLVTDQKNELQVLKYHLYKQTYRYLNIKLEEKLPNKNDTDDSNIKRTCNMNFSLHSEKGEQLSVPLLLVEQYKRMKNDFYYTLNKKTQDMLGITLDEYDNEIYEVMRGFTPKILYELFLN